MNFLNKFKELIYKLKIQIKKMLIDQDNYLDILIKNANLC